MSEIDLQITQDPLERLFSLSKSSDECGAEAVFIGKVRNQNFGRKVVSVFYDAFAPLAEEIFRKLAIEAIRRSGEEISISIYHRIGEVKVGEWSIVIRVESPHREEAFQACRFLIEETKRSAPIWKKEIYEDGESEWVKGHALCSHTMGSDHSCGRKIDSDEKRQSASQDTGANST